MSQPHSYPQINLTLAQKKLRKAVGPAGPAKNKIDDYSAGRFVAKPLQRTLQEFRHSVCQPIAKVT